MFILWLISSLGVLYSIDRYISPGLLIGSSSSGVLVNTTVHSTDPRISYSPPSKCARTLLGSCKHEDDPWEPVTYFSSGMVETFFQLIEPKDKSGSRHSASISFSFKGQAIYIYGPPRRHVKNPKEHVFCLDFSCSTVDVAKIYSDASRWNDEPVLLWSQDGLSGWRSHDVRLTLEDSKSTSGLFFHHLDFTVSEKDVP
ncbi:hypothetical protein FRC02_010322 [Tulasnella sp. 418]|nr:hypothetical protein FRC02_010322 [Tulasnella sp. 418]